MTLIQLTAYLGWGIVIGIGASDIALIVLGHAIASGSPTPPRTSYSEVIKGASAQHLELPFSAGAVCGHWFGPAFTRPEWTPLVLILVALALALLGWRQFWAEPTDDRPAWPRMMFAFGSGVVAGAVLWSQDPSHIISADIRANS